MIYLKTNKRVELKIMEMIILMDYIEKAQMQIRLMKINRQVFPKIIKNNIKRAMIAMRMFHQFMKMPNTKVVIKSIIIYIKLTRKNK